ncbi:hypothetical protein NXW04_22740 [Phocaeicola vulgatus]|nr:hypothetical protein [Phocaeicola vulgatus]
MKKELGKMKDLFNSEQLEALRHHFPNISKAMEEGKDLFKQITRSRGFWAWGITPPPPKGERPNGSLSQWSVTPFGFRKHFAGFGKRLCAYSKKVYGGAPSGRVAPPLAARRSSTDDF